MKATESNKVEIIKPDFGNTSTSRLMLEVYNDAKRVLGFEHSLAEKLAHSYGADLGRATAGDPELKAKLGKLTKNGEMTIRTVSTYKHKGEATPSMRLVKLIGLLNEAATYGLDCAGSEIVLREQSPVKMWLDEKAEKVA